ncbi:ABC transporter substrate-binding protein [Rubrivivax gelatinosus]|uniref:Putative ABC transporter substrate binding protein n=1 Tax=Rubrivivax gelatinosus (strain NBRC 100245 / IL144) TaxID=983917 RepID=I0HYC5_RUBGI|nr:ABC transporter substrate-binding protein [Rubrivivax gelatinosus]BAL98012.1 putative ABC transporter substrate binding protein [Rubrivivax gelatinosus IL144]
MKFYSFLAGVLLACTTAVHAAEPAADGGRKILRVAFTTAETGFDPAQLSDLYSRTVTPHIFEALYRYDHLARPVKIRPLTAAGMPEVSPDYRVWTVKLQPGIYFADDPAFKGKKRELVAQDYVYAFQRIADPANRSQVWGGVETFKIEGLADYRREVVAQKKRFDYDHVIPGLRALDRYTIRFTLRDPSPRFIENLTASDLLGAMAREVVEFYGDKIAEHPVGTGPFRLKQWRRSSLIVLERSPDFREMHYDAEPAADDAEGQAILARLKGRRIPMVDEVRISIIEEEQPRWLAFLNGQIDMLAGQYGSMPGSFINVAMPNGHVAPNLARKGIQAARQVNADIAIAYFNMEDPVVGGYTPEKVALRRAISLSMDTEREIRVIRKGQAIPAQSQIAPNTSGYDPNFKSEAGDYDPARARALLDMYGYVDRDGDGWRELPDGKPLVLVYATQPSQINRQFDELWRKNLEAIGIRTTFQTGQWPEQLKLARAGKLQIWMLGSSADVPDGQSALARLHGPQSGSQNLARFKLPAFDAIYDRLLVLPDGPERDELFRQAKILSIAYMPYKPLVHRISTDMWQPWVTGFRRPLFWQEWWHLVDVDPAMRAKAGIKVD